MRFDRRRAAVALAGFCAFVSFYAPQTILPEMAADFHVSVTQAGSTVGATALAVVGAAPIVGVLAEKVGRRNTLVGSAFLAVLPAIWLYFAQSLPEILVARFLQGLLLPGVFSSAVAYVAEEWTGVEAASVTSQYMAGAVLGGFSGRMILSFMADLAGWRSGFLVLAAITLVSAFAFAFWLPQRRRATGGASLPAIFRGMARHLRNPQLVASCANGSAMLFSMVGVLTYISFRLTAAPFLLGPRALGLIFVVYLIGIWSPWAATIVMRRVNPRTTLLISNGVCIFGILLTLSASLPVVVIGLAFFMGGGFAGQTNSLAFVGRMAGNAKSTAFGLYTCCYYGGGSLGSVLPGKPYEYGGWPAVVTLLAVIMAVATMIGWRSWSRVAEGTGAAV